MHTPRADGARHWWTSEPNTQARLTATVALLAVAALGAIYGPVGW